LDVKAGAKAHSGPGDQAKKTTGKTQQQAKQLPKTSRFVICDQK